MLAVCDVGNVPVKAVMSLWRIRDAVNLRCGASTNCDDGVRYESPPSMVATATIVYTGNAAAQYKSWSSCNSFQILSVCF